MRRAVGHAAAGGAAPARADPDARAAGVGDEVPDDEEVGREPHVGDDAELVVEALDDLGRAAGRPSAPRPPAGQVAEVPAGGLVVVAAVGRGEGLGQGEGGQLRLAELDLDVGPLGDPERVVARLGHLGEQGPHLGRRLQVVLVAVELEALRVVDGAAGLHAQQGVVGDRRPRGGCSGCRWWPAAARRGGGRSRAAGGWSGAARRGRGPGARRTGCPGRRCPGGGPPSRWPRPRRPGAATGARGRPGSRWWR